MWTLLSRFCRYSVHLARINSLFLTSTPSVHRMLSTPAALLHLSLRMVFSTSSNDDGSSCFGIICCIGRSSRKPLSVMWTLFSRLCRYSAYQARINFSVLIIKPSVHRTLPECCQAGMLSGSAAFLSMRLRMAYSTS